MSEKQLSESQTELLNLGPKFVPTLQKVPYMDIITSTELAAIDLNKANKNHDSERLRHDVSNILSKYITKKIPSNLSKQQQQALRELKRDNELKVIPFYKGTGFALLNNDDVIAKMREQLGEANLIKVIQNDTTNTLVMKF